VDRAIVELGADRIEAPAGRAEGRAGVMLGGAMAPSEAGVPVPSVGRGMSPAFVE
jgi:hypothetical protein